MDDCGWLVFKEALGAPTGLDPELTEGPSEREAAGARPALAINEAGRAAAVRPS